MTVPNSNKTRLLEIEGKQLFASGKFQQASVVFSRAADGYLEQGEDLLAAEMRNNQCVSLLQAKQAQKALVAVQGTAIIFEKAGDQLKYAMALANEATALQELRRYPDAIDKFTQSADLFDQLKETEMVLQVKQSISAMQLRSRNLFGALFSMQEGLEGVNKPTLRQKILLKLLKIPQNLMGK